MSSGDGGSAGRAGLVAVLVLAVVTALVGGRATVDPPAPAAVGEAGTIEVRGTVEDTTTTAPPTTTVPVADRLPPLATDVAGAVRREDGSALAVLGTDGEQWRVVGACGGETTEPAATARQIGPRHVVLDPAGDRTERGVEAGELVEAELNLDVARRVEALLTDLGVAVTLTRDADAELGAVARGALAVAVGAQALVSIHHAGADGATVAAPRPEVFQQVDDPESRRLGGLVHQELVEAFTPLGGEWAVVGDPGVKPLLNQRGNDYHVVLQASAGVPSVLVEVLALGEREAALLSSEEGRRLQAEALTRAIVRFLVSDETGGGFVEPEEVVRVAPTTNVPGGCS